MLDCTKTDRNTLIVKGWRDTVVLNSINYKAIIMNRAIITDQTTSSQERFLQNRLIAVDGYRLLDVMLRGTQAKTSGIL